MVLSEKQKEYMNSLKKIGKSKEYPFDLISKKISFLKMFIEIINKHPEELEDSYKKIINANEIEPAMLLNEYVILEIRNFYHTAYKKFKDTINYPSSAEKTGIVKEIRDNAIAHFDCDNVIELIELFEKFNKYGLMKVYEEWLEFQTKIFKKLNNDCNRIK